MRTTGIDTILNFFAGDPLTVLGFILAFIVIPIGGFLYNCFSNYSSNGIFVFLKNYLSFSGRYNRKKYFVEALKLCGLYILAGILVTILHLIIKDEDVFLPVFAVIFIPTVIILFLKYITNVVKRCHDLGFPTSAGVLVAILLVAANGTENIAAGLLTTFVALYLLLKRGNIGENQYGADPLNKDN